MCQLFYIYLFNLYSKFIKVDAILLFFYKHADSALQRQSYLWDVTHLVIGRVGIGIQEDWLQSSSA